MLTIIVKHTIIGIIFVINFVIDKVSFLQLNNYYNKTCINHYLVPFLRIQCCTHNFSLFF